MNCLIKKIEIRLWVVQMLHQVLKKWPLTATLFWKAWLLKVERDAEVSNPWMKSMRRNVSGSQHKNWWKLTRLKLSLQLKQKQKKTAFMVWGLPNNVRRLWMDWQSLSPNSRKPMLSWQKNKSCLSSWPTSIWIPWIPLPLKEIKLSFTKYSKWCGWYPNTNLVSPSRWEEIID